jgi:DNA-binding NtrC family response regulator
VRVSARRSLERAGYRVLEAGSAEQALEILGHETSAIELVVSDVGLPAMRGPELLALASALVPGVGTLLMSGDSRATLVRAGYIADDTEFLAKPFGAAELVEGVRGALDQRAAALPPASGIGRSGRAEEPTRERGK